MTFFYLKASIVLFQPIVLNATHLLTNQKPEFGWYYRIKHKQLIKSLDFAQKIKNIVNKHVLESF